MSADTERTVIGFDLGHGETALALASAGADDAPKVLDLPGATRRQHVTAVAQTTGGRVLIGEEAIRADDAVRLWLGFKSRELDAPDTRKPMQLLVRQIVADLIDAGTIPDEKTVQWVFGAPSGWTSQHYTAYEALLAEAGLSDARVVAESRAALLYARDSGEVDVLGSRITQGVLIVDIGSSTTDYTYVTDLAQKPVDHGNVDLGASLIDKEIMRWAVARHAESVELAAQLARDPHSARKLELACRESKEKFFRTRPEEIAGSGKRVGALFPLELTSGEEYVVDLRFAVSDMDAVLAAPQPLLGGRSWLGAFAEDVDKAVDLADGEVDLVLLTGGPSRMPFVLDVCRKLVGSEKVALGNEPEVAIARGLALAGRMSIRSAGFRTDITQVKSRIPTLVQEKIPDLAKAMAEAVATGMTERHVVPAFAAWRNMEIRTLDALVDRVVAGVRKDLDPAANKAIGKAVASWQNELRTEMDTITRPICSRWRIEPGALKLPKISVASGTAVNVAVDTSMLTDVFKGVAGVINAVVASIVAMTLFGGGVALIATGPLFPIFAAGIGFAALMAGTDELIAKMKGVDIPKFARRVKSEQAIATQIRKKADESERQLATSLAAEFEKEFSGKLTKQVIAEIGRQLDKAADGAELLIS